MIEVCSLSSGSNGNAFFIRTGKDCFLVDAGISCKQICSRLNHVGSNITEIKGIFITHEHVDHIQGLTVLLKKHSVPVYITEKTYNATSVPINKEVLRFIAARDKIRIGDTEIHSLPKSHDAAEPTFFCFQYKNKKISVITDAGYACKNIQDAVREANILFLESNYDIEMLKNGVYPPPLKNRVAGKRGHLSNIDAAEIVRNYAQPGLEYVFLSHLSENNNTPDIAIHTFKNGIKERKDLSHLQAQTILTSRHEISPVIKIPLLS